VEKKIKEKKNVKVSAFIFLEKVLAKSEAAERETRHQSKKENDEQEG
jgi:hypothetical protein